MPRLTSLTSQILAGITKVNPFRLLAPITINNPNAFGTSDGDRFSSESVDVSTDYAIIGADREDDAGGLSSGKAYIFNATTGALVHTLDNPNTDATSAGDAFGCSVGISGNYAIVGAVGEDKSFTSGAEGVAYIFNATTGTLVHTLLNPDPNGGANSGAGFGDNVAISGNYAIISATGKINSDDSRGAAYIFNVTTGLLVQTLANPDAFLDADDRFDSYGSTVGISGNYAIVGAPGEDVGGASTGSVYIFNASTGALLHTLANPNAFDTPGGDQFGYSVAISGNYAIVGAWLEDDASGTQSGKAYIFNATTGALVHTLDNPNAFGTTASDNFGAFVDISGNYAIVGAPDEDDLSTVISGTAYIFDVISGNLIQTIKNPNPLDNDEFSRGVAISNGRALVGTFQFANSLEGVPGTESGVAYLFNSSDNKLLGSYSAITLASSTNNFSIGDQFFQGETATLSVQGTFADFESLSDLYWSISGTTDDFVSVSGTTSADSTTLPGGSFVSQYTIDIEMQSSIINAGTYILRLREGSANGPSIGTYTFNIQNFVPPTGDWLDDNGDPVTVATIISPLAMQVNGAFAVDPTVPFTVQGAFSETITTITNITANTGTLLEVDDDGNANNFTVGESLSITAQGQANVVPNATNINEGATLLVQINTTNIPDGFTLYWTINETADFNISSGSVTVNSNSAVVEVTPLEDFTTEGVETFTFSVRSGSVGGPILASSSAITINDTSVPTYDTFVLNAASYNEGDTVTVSITSTNIPQTTTVNYTITGVAAGDVSKTSGTITVGQDGTGVDTFTLINDITTEGVELLEVTLAATDSAGNATGALSDSATVNDTSLDPSYDTFVLDATNYDEGDTVTVSITTSGGMPQGTTVGYTIISAIQPSAPDFSKTFGTITVGADGTGSDTFTIVTDDWLDLNDSFTVILDATDSAGYSTGSLSDSATINDTTAFPLVWSNPNNTAPATSDLFGKTIAVNDTFTLFGVPEEQPSNSGNAYLFGPEHNELVAFDRSTISSPSEDVQDVFGQAIALNSTYAAIGAPGDDADGTNAGRVYIYGSLSDGGGFVQTISHPDPAADLSFFGTAVALTEDYLAVGADRSATQSAGVVYIFSTSDWSLVRTIDNPFGATSGRGFGSSLAMEGNYVYVGAPTARVGILNNSGRVFAYRIDDGVREWFTGTPDPRGNADNYFGLSISVSGDNLAVGAYGAGGHDGGAVYVFDKSNNFRLKHRIDHPDATSLSGEDRFGASVSISGTNLVVGAPLYDTGSAAGDDSARGTAFLFDLSTTSLPTYVQVTNPDTNPNSLFVGDQFGTAVAISGDRMVIGAPFEDSVGQTNNSAGVAYVYDASRLTPNISAASMYMARTGLGTGVTYEAKTNGITMDGLVFDGTQTTDTFDLELRLPELTLPLTVETWVRPDVGVAGFFALSNGLNPYMGLYGEGAWVTDDFSANGQVYFANGLFGPRGVTHAAVQFTSSVGDPNVCDTIEVLSDGTWQRHTLANTITVGGPSGFSTLLLGEMETRSVNGGTGSGVTYMMNGQIGSLNITNSAKYTLTGSVAGGNNNYTQPSFGVITPDANTLFYIKAD